MPDSSKSVIYGSGIKKIRKNGINVDYYDGE